MDIPLSFAIPPNPLFAPLAAAAGGTHRIIVAQSERECAKLLMNHLVDAALISPLHYGLAATTVDYRIVPTTGLFLSGYTGVASVYFTPNLAEITRCVSASPDDFVITAGRILLAERYGLHPEFTGVDSAAVYEEFMKAGCAIGYEGQIPAEPSLDVSEDWLDSFEVPLPLALWVCRQDDDIPSELPNILRGLATPDLPAEQPVEEHICDNPDHHHEPERFGTIQWQWMPDSVEALESVFDIMFYHQLLPVIPEAKFWKD